MIRLKESQLHIDTNLVATTPPDSLHKLGVNCVAGLVTQGGVVVRLGEVAVLLLLVLVI